MGLLRQTARGGRSPPLLLLLLLLPSSARKEAEDPNYSSSSKFGSCSGLTNAVPLRTFFLGAKPCGGDSSFMSTIPTSFFTSSTRVAPLESSTPLAPQLRTWPG